ncbi:MAG: magnesium-translocating P-type ATPase [Verrucomicrobiae bacterium]|nr:magnesium-translocating P-type ATPase [Verrucomicrobiae bacterium]
MNSIFARIAPSLIVREARDPSHARVFSDSERRLVERCAASVEDCRRALDAAPQGLTPEEARRRLDKHGPNEIAKAERIGALRDLLRRCRNPLVIQLLVICGVSAAVGDLRAAAVVGGMIALSVALSFVQESRSTRAVEKLRAMVRSSAVALRDGRETEIPMAEVVPGDVVVLQAGSLIPADLRLISAKDFFVSQSALTGESMPVEKNAEPSSLGARGVMELANACFLGSNVLSGSARGLVVNTGLRTYFGSISERLAGQRLQTSFDRGIAAFTWLMIRFMTVMVSAVFLIVGLTKGNWIEALLFGLSVAVGLTPEMLPMIVTVNLSKGALSMSRRKVIVKQLPSIQNFGAIDILCTDKTGTLTQDRVVLERHVDVTGRDSDDVLRYAYMNSYYQTGLRNLLDRAVLSHGDLDVERNCRKVDEIPFDFQRRRMSVVIDDEGGHVLICKGAVEEVYACCDRYQVDEEIYPLIDVIRRDLFEEVERLNHDGFRVLAIAYREFSREQPRFGVADESSLILLGYIAFYDPPKESSAEAIRLLHRAGVRVKILTGDNPFVARKVCADVGLEAPRLVTGDELVGLPPERLSELAEETTVFARLSPSQKERIIQALQQRGHVVGYLGDGINDAPSLRTADVGISVDTAVDVAKEAADIVLLEKSLLVLEEGIMEGRRVFANISKYIRMGASSNFGNMFSVLGASYLLPFLPMRPVQILVNNLLYDISQTGIPTDRVDEELIAKPRRWNIANIKRFMLVIGPISSIFDYATFALMWFVFGCRAWLPSPAGASLEKLFQTGWFVESLLTQTLIVHIIRTRRVPFFGSRASGTMTFTTLAVMAVGVWLPWSPFATALGLVPLPLSYWAWIAGFLMTYGLLTHKVKTWFFRKFGDD